MLRTQPAMKFQATPKPVREPLKQFPKPFKANRRSFSLCPLSAPPKLAITKASLHGPNHPKEDPSQEGYFTSMLHHVISKFHIYHDEGNTAPGEVHVHHEKHEGKPVPGKLRRISSGRKVVESLRSNQEWDEEMEEQFMANIESVDIDDLQKDIAAMRTSKKKEEAIKKLEEQQQKLNDKAHALEILIIQLLIYQGNYMEAYRRVLPLAANSPVEDKNPHVLLALTYHMMEPAIGQQGEPSKEYPGKQDA